MKQDISPTIPTRTRGESKPSSASLSSAPSRPRTFSHRAKDSPKLENGVSSSSPQARSKPMVHNGNGVSSPSQNARAKSVPRDTSLHSNQRTNRSVLLSKPESPSSSQEVKPVPRTGNRPAVEQFSRPRRRRLSSDPNSNPNHHEGVDLVGKRSRELEEKLEHNEVLIGNLQSQVLELKSELEKANSLNSELQLRNTKLSEELEAAEAKIAAVTTRDQVTTDYQSPKFKDIQKLIATKLEYSKFKSEAISDVGPARALSAAPPQPITVASANAQKNVPACHLPPPPPPLPPPPPPRARARAATTTLKYPAVVESSHLLANSDRSKYSSGSVNRDKPVVMSAHSSIVGEIQKRSAHLIAIKADIETKGDFINSLIEKVMGAAYKNIEDVLNFVDWLDNQLSSLADEQAVLKHFKWPEKKADAMREAAVEYRGLKLLESEISSYKDDTSIPCGLALKKMAGLLDKSEQNIQRLIKLRSSVMRSYQHFKIPTDWMLDSGIISKIKQGWMMLAKIYMKRVTMELESIHYSERESTQEGLLLQGVHFAYRAHQFAGGFDSETLCAFEEIRQRVPLHLQGSQELLAGIQSS